MGHLVVDLFCAARHQLHSGWWVKDPGRIVVYPMRRRNDYLQSERDSKRQKVQVGYREASRSESGERYRGRSRSGDEREKGKADGKPLFVVVISS